MTKYEKFLLYYLSAISTIVLIFVFFLSRKPLGREKTCPVPAAQITCPQTEAVTGINQLNEELKAVRGELAKMRADQRGDQTTLGAADEEIIEDLSLEAILATPTGQTSPALGQLTLKSLNTADVHQEKSSSSIVIGRIFFGKNYPYFQKSGNWYLINKFVSNEIKTEVLQGWVNASLVKTVN